MRALAVPALLLAAALAGCASQDSADDHACPATNTWARIASVEGSSLTVRLMDGSAAVVHVEDRAGILQQVGGDCFEAFWSGVEPGKEVAFQAGAWAESSPPQAWVDTLVLLG